MHRRHLLRRRKIRVWLSGIAALCLLLNQWAVAAYVCPHHFDGAAAGQSSVALPQCHQHADPKQPGLCHEHCNPTSVAASVAKAPTVPPAIIPALSPTLAPNPVLAVAPDSRIARDYLIAPPPCIEQLCRFLI